MDDLLKPEEIRDCPVLYVDDDEENLLGLQMTFRRQFRIIIAKSAAEALEIMEREPIGVLLADQRMPEVTGVELIEQAHQLYPGMVHLIITAYSDFDALVYGINTGALSGFIQKPWEPAEVELTLRTAIERHLLSKKLRQRTEQLAEMNLELERKVRERTLELEVSVDQLNRANAQLAELNRLKDDFVSFCTHDLRSPLSALTGFIDLTESRLSRIGEIEVFAHTLHSMRQVVEEMSSLVDHILDLSRLQSGREKLRLANDTIDAAISHSLATMCPLAQTKQISLEVELDDRLQPITHDSERMTQVISNLLSNAVKFTHPGGSIKLRVFQEDAESQILEVIDSGIGMEPEICQTVFTESQRHRRTGTRGERSNGLGLGICKRIVAMHGGEIWVDSNPGEGSKFSIRLRKKCRDPQGGDEVDSTLSRRDSAS